VKRASLKQIVRYNDELHEVVGIGDGRTITLAPVPDEPCPHCGWHQHVHLLEHSRLFQDSVKPVETIG